MNSIPTIARISILAGCCCLAQTTAQAASIAAGEQILNGGFQTVDGSASLTNWTPSPNNTYVNARLATNTINTSGGNAGFNNFFSSAFAVLGDTSGAIGGGPNAGTSTISQSFTLASSIGSVLIQDYDLNISFSTVFDGQDNATTTPTNSDIFSAALFPTGDPFSAITLFTQNSLNFPNGTPTTNSANNQLTNNLFSTTIFGLSPGSYTLSFILNEKSGAATETAAGIDNVSVTASGNPVPVPEPSTLLLLGIGLAGSASFRLGKKRLS